MLPRPSSDVLTCVQTYKDDEEEEEKERRGEAGGGEREDEMNQQMEDLHVNMDVDFSLNVMG